MFLGRKTHEAYWNSYRLLESQLLRLSHSIWFNDEQINVYSSELADIINSACIKIESLAKDIYEEHIYPFQMDDKKVPKSFTDGKPKRSAEKFKPENWVREKWKFDYHCLNEIDSQFSLSKKRVKLKIERFQFRKYGDSLLPFGNISLDACKGGYWEYSERDQWCTDKHKLANVDWCKSYQEIKHNYIESIPAHGTVKNAVMVLSAFYLLAVYHSCLPSCRLRLEDVTDNHRLDFGSELFSCGVWYRTTPPCIIDSDYIKYKAEEKERRAKQANSTIFDEHDLLHDIEGFPFLITLNKSACDEVNRMVEQYCAPRNLEHFDIAPYEGENGVTAMDEGAVLYQNLRKYIRTPYCKNNLCVSLNTGLDRVYESLFIEHLDYEKSKYTKQTAEVLATLKVGDFVEAKFIFDREIARGEVVKLDEYCIYLSVQVDGTPRITSDPKSNIIYIRKLSQ